jgi:hypothetical protein
VSILVKAGTGLAAGLVAGALGLAFFPRVEPTALRPRSAVEKPQFVVTTATTPTTVATTRAAPAVAVASETATPEAKPTAEPEPSRSPVALASLDPPKAPPAPAKTPAPFGESRSIGFAAMQPTQPAPANAAIALAETRATAAAAQPLAPALKPSLASAAVSAPQPAPAAANDVSARWSVRGLVALAKGDLSSARLYLTRAAEAGDPRALVALADTYDPAILAKLGVVVAPGDAQRAKDYLIKAAAAGVVAAKDRMAAIDSNAQSVR